MIAFPKFSRERERLSRNIYEQKDSAKAGNIDKKVNEPWKERGF